MTTSAEWSAQLADLAPAAWPEFLASHSGLPGPRANLSLVDAAARIAHGPAIEALLRDGGEYATMCAAAAIARGATDPTLREQSRGLARDERWRVREGVVLGLQMLADAAPQEVISITAAWADDADALVQRAAVATICEPRLLRSASAAAFAIDVCERCTRRIRELPPERRADPPVRALRQTLGYGWSVAVAADPEPGLAAFRRLDMEDTDVAWIIRENSRKKRLSSLL